MARNLLEPILDGGIRNPHYFEGRLLTAEALRADQEAHRARQRHLGRALGAGVVEGLEVTIESRGVGDDPPVLAVEPGLAIDRRGDTIELTACEAIALTRSPEKDAIGPCLFRDCLPPSVGIETTGEGFYVLVLSPVSGYRERAPMSGLTETKAGAGCGSRWVIEGVQLRLEPLDPLATGGVSDGTRDLLQDELLGATDGAALSKLRNVLAHLCLGTEHLAGFAEDPFAREIATGGTTTRPALAAYGVLDDLAAAGRLSDCDVPLALLDWRLDGIAWLDLWAVRRRPSPAAREADWPMLSAGRRRAEAEAALFQFQDQLAELLDDTPSPGAVRARDHFRWLPPAGLLPLGTTGGSVGFSSAFFDPLPHRDPIEYLNGEQVGYVLHRSLSYEAIDLNEPEMLWLYLPWQQEQARAAGRTARSHLLFASGHLPPVAVARFDVARWDFSNLADRRQGDAT